MFLRISCGAKIKTRNRDVIRLETEIQLQGLLQPSQRKQTTGNKHTTKCHLHHNQDIPEGETARGPAWRIPFQDGIGIGPRSAPCGRPAEKARGDEGNDQSKKKNSPVRVYIELHGEIHRRPPVAKPVRQQCRKHKAPSSAEQ